MAIVGVHSFEAKIASRGYHINKRNSWSKARDGKEIKVQLETSQSSKKKVDLYACVIRAKEEYFKRWKIVEHISREISRHVYYTLFL